MPNEAQLKYLRTFVEPGDVIAFTGNGWRNHVINVLTYGIPGWSISHVGLVGNLLKHPGPLLFETLMSPGPPCVLRGESRTGAQVQRIEHYLDQDCGPIWHYKLYRPMYAHEKRRLHEILLKGLDTPYDLAGAVRSGGMLTAWVSALLRGEDKSAMFCSEWTADGLRGTGIFTTSNISRWNPNKLIRRARLAGVLRKPVRLDSKGWR